MDLSLGIYKTTELIDRHFLDSVKTMLIHCPSCACCTGLESSVRVILASIHVKISIIFVFQSTFFATWYPNFGCLPNISSSREGSAWACVQFVHFLLQTLHKWQQTYNPRRTCCLLTGCPNLPNKCSRNKRQYKRSKTGPKFCFNP